MFEIIYYEEFRKDKSNVLWKDQFKRFCVEESSEIMELIMNTYKTLESLEKVQIILAHQFKRKYLISDEYLMLYIQRIIDNKIPLTASIYGEENFIREDERYEEYLHPNDIMSVNIPKFWKNLFYNELLFHSNSYVTNVYLAKRAVLDRVIGRTRCTKFHESDVEKIDDFGVDWQPP